MKTLKAIKYIANFTALFATLSYILLIGTLVYNFILAVTNKIYGDAILAIVFAALLCGIAHVFVDAADKVCKEQEKALKDKQTNETVP